MSIRTEIRFGVKQGISAILLTGFALFTFFVYTSGTEAPEFSTAISPAGEEGRLLWQKFNCAACHQLYGLGGYVGPDLTNVMSAPGKGRIYVNAILKVGTNVMPDFKLAEEEIAALTAFLEYVDGTGNFPEPGAKRTWFGAFDIE